MLTIRSDLVTAVCTILQARPTINALTQIHTDLKIPRKTLGIVTPPTAQGTSLEKNGGPNPGTIVRRKALNIENNTSHI